MDVKPPTHKLVVDDQGESWDYYVVPAANGVDVAVVIAMLAFIYGYDDLLRDTLLRAQNGQPHGQSASDGGIHHA